MNGIFTGGIDVGRLHPAGLTAMALALLLAALSGSIAEKTGWTQGIIKLIALVLCAGGALLAILA